MWHVWFSLSACARLYDRTHPPPLSRSARSVAAAARLAPACATATHPHDVRRVADGSVARCRVVDPRQRAALEALDGRRHVLEEARLALLRRRARAARRGRALPRLHRRRRHRALVLPLGWRRRADAKKGLHRRPRRAAAAAARFRRRLRPLRVVVFLALDELVRVEQRAPDRKVLERGEVALAVDR
eukprot:614791-Prymnesium_polylepis.1